MVVVKWWGHACFEIMDSAIVVTDPHDGKSVGMPVPKVSADIVLVSHSHLDHASGKSIVAKPEAKILDKPGNYEIKGVKVKGVTTFHDDSGGSKRGSNTIFVFEVGGIRFAHLGDLGHILSDKEVREIGPIDILMIPVGGYYTIDADTASAVVDKVKPKIVIPMHYKVEGLDYLISGVEAFPQGKDKYQTDRKIRSHIFKRETA